jgi:O-methyltransferase
MSQVTKPLELSPLRAAVRVASRRLGILTRGHRPMTFPTYSHAVAKRIEQYPDEIRYSTLALAIQRLELDQVSGAFAEIGVYRGATSSFIHHQSPNRRFYLFDTFEGFPSQDLEGRTDARFSDTSQEAVERFIGGNENIVFRKGYFPDTACGLEREMFALVMLDCDLYRTSLAALAFFYPRMKRGGYFFMHDFNSPESDHGVSRAAADFMADKAELLTEVPDQFGSALFRKI